MSALATVYPTVVASAPHVVNQLPMPAWVYGAIALGVALVLLVFTWFFRHTAAAIVEGGRGPQGHHGAPTGGSPADTTARSQAHGRGGLP